MSMRTRTFPLTQYSSDHELGFSLRAARVHTQHIYIHATCKRHVEKGLTLHLLFTVSCVIRLRKVAMHILQLIHHIYHGEMLKLFLY